MTSCHSSGGGHPPPPTGALPGSASLVAKPAPPLPSFTSFILETADLFARFQEWARGNVDGTTPIVAGWQGGAYMLAEVMFVRFVIGLTNRNSTRNHLSVAYEEHPFGGQLMGSLAGDFAPAASKLAAAG